MTLKKSLIISPFPTHGSNSGNKTRLFQSIELLKSLKFEVYFCYVPIYPFGNERVSNDFKKYWGSNYEIFQNGISSLPTKTIYLNKLKYRKNQICSWMGINFLNSINDFQFTNGYLPVGLSRHIVEFCKKNGIDVVILEYAFMSKLFSYLPKSIIKIIETHDIFTNRNKKIRKLVPDYHWFNLFAFQEKILLRNADYIIAIQENEKDFFINQLELNNVVLIDILKPSIKLEIFGNKNYNIGLVASNIVINKNGYNHFINEIWPLILHEFPNAYLLVAGSICSSIENIPPRTSLLGQIDNLKSFFEICRFTINPVSAGTGLKIKTIESLTYGKAIVSTPEGVSGLEKHLGEGFIVADSPELFASHCIKLLQDELYLESLNSKALQFINSKYELSMNIFKSIIENKIIEK
jgi:hypothetical protein